MTDVPIFEVVDETGSTNTDLIKRLRNGERLKESYWLRAKRQTSGRGRMGRVWENAEGNLFCSTVVTLEKSDPAASTLSFVTALAAFDAIHHCLLPNTPVSLKWPNDVLVRNAKLAGILLEREGDAVVVGIGINVSFSPVIPGRETTHLAYENGKFANGPDSVLDLLAQHFADRLATWRNLPLCDTLLEWSARSHRFGEKLKISDANGVAVYGHYRGINHDGSMRFQPIGAVETTIHAGDVALGWHDNEGE